MGVVGSMPRPTVDPMDGRGRELDYCTGGTMPLLFADGPEFAKLVHGCEAVDLTRLMFELARDAYPDLNVSSCLQEIERLGCHAQSYLQEALDEEDELRDRLAAVSHVMYDVEGFHGNEHAYYDPRNSYLNEVLSRRCGIPISLGVLYMDVARRAGIETFGVPTPGHFMVGCRVNDQRTLYVDPFRDGDVLEEADCRRRIERSLGQEGTLEDRHFLPAPPLVIAVRVLRNLKGAYALANQWPAALPVQQRLALLCPQDCEEHRDLGLIYLRNGEPRPAVKLLEDYVGQCDAKQALALEPFVRSARRMVAELN